MRRLAGSRFVLVCSLGVAVVFAEPSPCSGTTRLVPSEYATINMALDASAFGDTVLVAAGTYSTAETRYVDIGTGYPIWMTSLAFLKDGIVLRSEDGPEVTVLDLAGQGTGYACVVLAGGLTSEETKIEGLTLTGAPVGGNGLVVQMCGRMTVENCIFRDLDAGDEKGGGIVSNETALVVRGCEFRDCHSDNGGGINQTDPEIVLESCVFERCSELAVRASGDQMFPGIVATVQECMFRDNESSIGGGALGIVYYQHVTVEDCIFEGNAGQGSGAGLTISSATSTNVRGNVFADNHAANYGGGLSLYSGTATIENNTFYRCRQDWTYDGGSAMILYGGSIDLTGNVIASSQNAAAVHLWEGTITTACNVFWGNPEGDVEGFVLGATDRVVDPQFCDPDAGDLTVAESSPCLPANSGGCDLIGALGAGCGPVSLAPLSWGRIKGMYR